MIPDNTRAQVREATEAEVEAMRIQPRRQHEFNLSELLAFCDELRAEGFEIGPEVEQVKERWEAVVEATTFNAGKHAVGDLLSLDPDQIVERVRRAVLDVAVQRDDYRSSPREAFERQLSKIAGAAMGESAEGIVLAMRAPFDASLDIIKNANAAGLTTETDDKEILHSGSVDAIEAYRAIPEAVAKLEAIAARRIRISDILHYGPVFDGFVSVPHVAAFVTNLDRSHNMEGAENRWEGPREYVQRNSFNGYNGAGIHQIYKPRLGGRWLALVNGGYTVNLNTAEEAEAAILADDQATSILADDQA